MALGEWEERWQQNKIGFHQPEVHKMLKKNIDKVLNGRTGVRFFFPLCGKAVDMKWLADMGHAVVGVEISEKAIRKSGVLHQRRRHTNYLCDSKK
uniref:Probable thiopurine S-methyltransferase n=1 Tax=Haplochromis burtoni TaxID=8153 RepID=A0A3Q3CET7_HAPBU